VQQFFNVSSSSRGVQVSEEDINKYIASTPSFNPVYEPPLRVVSNLQEREPIAGLGNIEGGT
jgi:hypothetical protein